MLTTLTTAILVAISGVVLLWANPTRSVNKVVFSCSIHLSGWLMCLYTSFSSAPGSERAVFWLRTACAVGGALPLHFALVKDSIVTRLAAGTWSWARRHWVGILVTVFLVAIPYTESFIPAHSTAAERIRGIGYKGFTWVIVGFCGYLVWDSIRDIRRLSGGEKLELQVWLIGGCSVILTVIALMVFGEWTANRDVRSMVFRLQPVVILMFYAGTIYYISTSRIFDARQILIVLLEKVILIVGTAGFAYALDNALNYANVPAAFAFLCTVGVTLWLASEFSRWLDRKFQFFPAETAARQAVFNVARRETNLLALEKAFVGVLKGWGGTDNALVLSRPTQASGHDEADLASDGIGSIFQFMKELKWATPESLAREKSTPERVGVSRYLAEKRLGVLVFGEGPSLTVLVGVGAPASRRPYTYPQVMQLSDLTTIIENSLERTHYLVKAQHAEQLATVGLLGASLAHEIRNPLVSIKTFVQLLPKHHQDEAFRDKFFRLISDEVGRIDRLTEQLLEMATPRVYTAAPLHLHPLIRSSLDLVAAKADDRRIKIIPDFEAEPDVALTDATATKQVLLNLCFNAVHAVENRDGDRWIRVATRNVNDGIELAISDNGPGVSADLLPKLFQPFQTTKSTGFGLGLAICSDILSGLRATIAVDPPRSGTGATFRVRFPCPPLSS